MNLRRKARILGATALGALALLGATQTTVANAAATTGRASVPNPTSLTVTSNIPDKYQVLITPNTQLGDAELLSGGPAIVLVADYGRVSFLNLRENTEVSFRYRNKIWNPATSRFNRSAWVNFSFRTPTFDSLRPAAPTNIREEGRTPSTITLRWDPVVGAARYAYSINNGAPIPTGTVTCAYCSPTDPLTATIPRPSPGSSVTVSVTAERNPIPAYCGPYCFPDLRFITSLPSTVVVTG